MATYTAQILIGQGHIYDGGIIPTHELFLSENSRPAWILQSSNVEGNVRIKKKVWIPTKENMLEDGLLMLGLYVLRNEELTEMAKNYFKRKQNNRYVLYDDIASEDLKKMYDISRNIQNKFKLVITTFKGSTIEDQLKVLENYKMDIEVCKVVYRREYNVWSQKVDVEGKL